MSRQIFMTESLYGQCHPINRSTNRDLNGAALANLRVQMEAFLTGEEVVEKRQMTWLAPVKRNMWELRAFMKPAVRLVGWFHAHRVFICTHVSLRSTLGPGGSAAWIEIVDKSETKRAELKLVPFVANTFDGHMN
ncbi:hypothetical protein [Phaeospirillum tilakii]|uniref:Uncharacterized protein n=1 Tax=Phaeospirillum tilakii TaxID=741673 RepID=A0ABW5CB68_9PROT